MNTIRVVPRRNTNLIHVETELGIVNIHLGLQDNEGRRVEHIEILPDGFADGPNVTLDGNTNSRLIQELTDG